MSPSFLRWLARWLLGAMLLATLAPAVSRTLADARQDGDWVEICTTQGMAWAQVGADDAHLEPADLNQRLLKALDLCGHCALTGERFAPLLPSAPVVASDAGPGPLPGHTHFSIRVTHAPSPSARGPPLLN